MAEKADRFQAAQAERFRPYPQYRDSGLDWLGEIPAHWEVKKWRYCCHVSEGQIAPDDEQFRERVLIAPNHIESGTGRLLHLETAREQGAISGKYLVGPGDIVYSKIRPALNKVCIATGDWLCSADMYPVSITESRLQTKFLLYFMLSAPYVQLMVDQSMRVAMPKVNRDKLAACPLLVPDPAEQRAIADFLDRETAKIDALVARKERLIELLQEKRTALITRAVTRGLDPHAETRTTASRVFPAIPKDWVLRKLRRLVWQVKRPLVVRREAEYQEIGIRSWGKGIFHKDPVRGALLGGKSVFLPEPGDFVLNIVFAWEGAVAVVSENEKGMIASHRFPTFRPSTDVDLDYFLMVLQSDQGRSLMEVNSPGAAGRNRTLRIGQFGDEELPLPPLHAQRAIVAAFRAEERRIAGLEGKVRKAIDHFMELRTALISAAVTGKFDVRKAKPQ